MPRKRKAAKPSSLVVQYRMNGRMWTISLKSYTAEDVRSIKGWVRRIVKAKAAAREFDLDLQAKQGSGFALPRGTPIHSRPIGGVACKFRTCYDTTLWPITVADAQGNMVSFINSLFSAFGSGISAMPSNSTQCRPSSRS